MKIPPDIRHEAHPSDSGTLSIHRELEQLIARFVGKADSLVFGMGFATNALNIPSLVDEVRKCKL